MKKSLLIIISVVTVLSIPPLFRLYYYRPRNVDFELDRIIPIPWPEYDLNIECIGFNYIRNAENLHHWLSEFPAGHGAAQWSFDSLAVESISKELDYEQYDYLMTYCRKMEKLQHSPYLRKTRDGIYFDKRIPLIPTWADQKTHDFYFYRIKKSKRFRNFGP